MNAAPKISIVIPLYNTDKYIERAILSVVEQDIEKSSIEVIVIDDGSSDHSVMIVEKMVEQYNNIKLLKQQNSGPSIARNYGINSSTGKYVMFLDSDDYITPNVFDKIISKMDQGELDMLGIDFIYVDSDENPMDVKCNKHNNVKGDRIYSGAEFLVSTPFITMTCVYIYNREFLKSNSLHMLPIRHEDEEFTPRALYRARRVQQFDDMVYCYRQHTTSFSKGYKGEHLFDLVTAMQSVKEFALSLPENAPATNFLLNRVNLMVMMGIKRSIRERLCVEHELIARCKELNLIPMHMSHSSFSFKRFLLNNNSELFIRFYRFIKNR